MFVITSWVGYLGLFLGVAVMGAVGGVVYELLIQRPSETKTPDDAEPQENIGVLERPSVVGTRWIELGWFASALIGAVAAISILYFLPPKVVEGIEKRLDGTEIAVEQHQVDIIQLVALALLAGSAGPAVIATGQSRLTAALNKQQAQHTKRIGEVRISAVAAMKDIGQFAERENFKNAKGSEVVPNGSDTRRLKRQAGSESSGEEPDFASPGYAEREAAEKRLDEYVEATIKRFLAE